MQLEQQTEFQNKMMQEILRREQVKGNTLTLNDIENIAEQEGMISDKGTVCETPYLKIYDQKNKDEYSIARSNSLETLLSQKKEFSNHGVFCKIEWSPLKYTLLRSAYKEYEKERNLMPAFSE